MSVGWDFNICLVNDGTVWAWGHNGYGALGDGTDDNKFKPIQVTSLERIISIDTSETHSVALKDDGSVWSWGKKWGKTKDDPADFSEIPRRIDGLEEIVSVKAGHNRILALRQDGTVWLVGSSHIFEKYLIKPRQIIALPRIAELYECGAQCLAKDQDGQIWVWGYNGSLGLEVPTYKNEESIYPPQLVSSLSDILIISQGGEHSLALDNNRTIWFWGDNRFGQAGDVNITSSRKPIQVDGLPPIHSISAGLTHSTAVDETGNVWYWGADELEQNILNKKEYSDFRKVENLPSVTAIASYRHTLVFTEDDELFAWGPNEAGQLGIGGTHDHTQPVKVQWADQ